MRNRPNDVEGGEKLGQEDAIGQVIERLRNRIEPELLRDFEVLVNELNSLHNQILRLAGWREGAVEALALACGMQQNQS